MGVKKVSCSRLLCSSVILALLTTRTQSATTSVKDIFNLNTQPLQRVQRDSKYYLGRYGSSSGPEDGSRTLKPEESPEARQGEPGAVEKRCSRCNDYDRYDRYDTRSRYNDDRYDTKRSRYPDYDYDRYDRYDKDRGYDRYDRYDTTRYDRYDSKSYDRYDRDRYEPRDRYESRDRYYDRNDRDRDGRDRYQDRGTGYDNRGYDYRGSDRGYDRGSGYGARPDQTYGTGYASSWYYGSGAGGRGDGRGDDYYKDRGGYRDQGYGGGGYRNRDPYYDLGYRGTSYLYGRPSSTTTMRPSSQDDNSVTDSPQETNSPSG